MRMDARTKSGQARSIWASNGLGRETRRLRPIGGVRRQQQARARVEEEKIKVTIEGMTRREATSADLYARSRPEAQIQRGSCDVVEGKKDGGRKNSESQKPSVSSKGGNFAGAAVLLLSHFIGPAISRRGEVPGTLRTCVHSSYGAH